MESCPTQAELPLVGLAADKVIRGRYTGTVMFVWNARILLLARLRRPDGLGHLAARVWCSRSRAPPRGLDTQGPHGCHGLVPWWFTLAATHRPDTPLLPSVAWNVTDHGTSPWHLHLEKPFLNGCNGRANVRGYQSFARERLRFDGKLGGHRRW
ncbi:MAG: hypothetical protein ACQESR_05855 [Planctomycetota bacterium]